MNFQRPAPEFLRTWLIQQGTGDDVAYYLTVLIFAIALFLLAWLSNYIARKVLLVTIHQYVKRSRNEWDDALLRRHVFTRLSHLAPALVLYYAAYLFPAGEIFIRKAAQIYLVLIGAFVFSAFLNAVVDIYNTYDISRQRPIKGYMQVVKIIVFIFVAVFLVASVFDYSPWGIVSGLGAMTAVLLLIFKDSILGLVAGVQLSFNDMVRIGDWIEMPKYGADGDVIDITLNTVKVQNWDKTITTIPAYAMISDSFKNWRGMQESGGRRIKRAVYIDMNSIKFCTDEMLEKFRKIQHISEYIDQRQEEIDEYNKKLGIDTSITVNGRRMTNIGTFRAYITAYLRNHPMINENMTFLIRHLQPTEHGLPIQIYVFSKDKVWANYESIQADIFDHILAVVPHFELRVFQNPSGSDIGRLAGSIGKPDA